MKSANDSQIVQTKENLKLSDGGPSQRQTVWTQINSICTNELLWVCVCTQSKKKDGKDQETIQSSTTPDPGYHMGK